MEPSRERFHFQTRRAVIISKPEFDFIDDMDTRPGAGIPRCSLHAHFNIVNFVKGLCNHNSISLCTFRSHLYTVLTEDFAHYLPRKAISTRYCHSVYRSAKNNVGVCYVMDRLFFQ